MFEIFRFLTLLKLCILYLSLPVFSVPSRRERLPVERAVESGEDAVGPNEATILHGIMDERMERRYLNILTRMQILCRGAVPFRFYQEMVPSVVPAMAEYPTVRSICALPELGGSPVWNAGLYCGSRLANPRLVFSELGGGRGLVTLDASVWDQIAMLCQGRCRCLEDLERENVLFPAPEVVQADSSPFANLDLNPPRIFTNEVDIRLRLLEYHGPHVPITIVERWNFLMAFEDIDVNIFAVMPQEGTYAPICEVDLPPTSLPPPFVDYPFRNLRILCAAEVFGGSPQGNAGAICSKDSHVIKFDEFFSQYVSLINYVLSLRSRRILSPALVRYASPEAYAANVWCQTHCKCGSYSPTRRVKSYNEDDTEFYDPKFVGKGLILSRKGKGKGGKTESIEIIPRNGWSSKGTVGNSISEQRTCAVVSTSSDATCNPSLGVDLSRGRPDRSTIQEALLSRPVRPLSPPPIHLGTYNARLLPITANAGEAACAALTPPYCHSFNECASSLASNCRCAIDLARNMASVGSLASALTAFSCISASTRTETGGRLGGRSTGLEDLVCPCNSTFASRTCCESVDGLVWEGENFRLELS